MSLRKNAESEAILSKSIQPLGVDGLRVDSWISESSPGDFHSVIGRRIAASSICIGIFVGAPTNIAYEIGKAVGLGKPVILLARSLAEIPTMLSGTDVVVYGKGPVDHEKMRNKIDERVDLLLSGQFADERVVAHVAQLRRKPFVSKEKPRSLPKGNDLLAKAISLYHLGQYEDAIAVIEQGLSTKQLGACDGLTFYYLADSCFLLAEGLPEGEEQMTLFQKMLRAAERGNRDFPRDERLHKTLGLAHLKTRNLPRAKEVFQDLVREHPGYPLARYNMACIHAQCGELLPCIEVLRALFATARNNESWRYLARLDPDFDPIWEEDLFQRLLYPTKY